MEKIVVLTHPADRKLVADFIEDDGALRIVTAQEYLTDPSFAAIKNAHVYNLCREYKYQTRGYYVSLLAEARQHRVMPTVMTIQDLRDRSIVRVVSDELDDLVQRTLRRISGSEPFFESNIYFGRSVVPELAKLSRQLYELFRAPYLRARFVLNKQNVWTVHSVRFLGLKEIPEDVGDREVLRSAAREVFARKRFPGVKKDPFVYDLAILTNPEEAAPPSDKRAIAKFVEAAQSLGFSTEMLTRTDAGRIGEFDALFIRETTAVNHHTYRIARKAAADGLIVIDDPDSILRCTNKVYLAELLGRAKIRTPRTMIVHTENRERVEAELGLPCVLKLPDSSFSQGVEKAANPEELRAKLDRMLGLSDLIIAQEFLPTDYDWRIGLIDGAPLYACRYYMARGHWQIYNWDARQNKRTAGDFEGEFDSVPVSETPENVISTALRAAALIGDGFYGVDLKELADGTAAVIEVNDNPSIERGVEDGVLGDELYRTIMMTFRKRLEQRRAAPGKQDRT